jgi:hypothetical protein
METIRIEIVNPKAKRIIEQLAELNLIAIRDKDPVTSFRKLLTKLRSNPEKIELEEITKEVDRVRTRKHARKS